MDAVTGASVVFGQIECFTMAFRGLLAGFNRRIPIHAA